MGHSDLDKLFEEKNRVAKLSQIREIVFGTEDGLLVPLGVVSGVAGATTNNFYVLIAGLAEAFAGSISMGAGAYLSSKAEREVQEWAIKKEMNEVETVPDEEKREIDLDGPYVLLRGISAVWQTVATLTFAAQHPFPRDS